MASIPPTGAPSQPTPPPEPSNALAKKLASATGSFIEKTEHVLNSPHLADDPATLEKYAQCVTSLHQLSQETGG